MSASVVYYKSIGTPSNCMSKTQPALFVFPTIIVNHVAHYVTRTIRFLVKKRDEMGLFRIPL